MKHARKLSALLALLTVLASFAACASEPQSINGGNADAETTTAETTIEETTTQPEYDIPEVVDYEGYEYRIGINKETNTESGIMYAEEMDGEVLNDAIFKRNSSVADRYNINIVGVINSSDTIEVAVKSSALAGDDDYDIISLANDKHFNLAKENLLLELNNSELDLEQPWWDQTMLERFGIYGKNYAAVGDLTTEDDICVLVMMFNTQLYNDFGFENSYTMVSEGRWTFDTFWDMVKIGSYDLNGDGVMDTGDRWGFITECSSWYYYSIGAGFEPIRHTSDGGLEYVLDDEKTFNLLEKTKQIILDDTLSLMAEGVKVSAPHSTCWEVVEAMFRQNQGLFKSGNIYDITRYRDMEIDFGMLPMPKLDEAQDSYHNLVTHHADSACFPITLSDETRTMLITDALGYESMQTVSEAFYDIFLDEKLVRDEESKGMIDIILDTKVYDIEFTTSLSGLSTMMYNLSMNHKDNFASQWASIKDAADAKLAQFVEDISHGE